MEEILVSSSAAMSNLKSTNNLKNDDDYNFDDDDHYTLKPCVDLTPDCFPIKPPIYFLIKIFITT